MIKSNRIIWLGILGLCLAIICLRSPISTTLTGAKPDEAVISLGEDLTPEQKDRVMEYFKDWTRGKRLNYISVSNEEERNYLQGLVDEKLIGSRAISSAYCELLDQGNGIEIQTENISAITPFMYANALITAGIEDARVVVAAPVEVSGTAALTGIIKAFEKISGESLKEANKFAAHEEMAQTSDLGKRIGQDQAQMLIYEVKKQVVADNSRDPELIRKIIIDTSAELNIKLSQADIDRMLELMQKLQGLNISAGQMLNQMQNLEKRLDEVQNRGEEAVAWLKQLRAAWDNLLAGIKNLFGA
ncbi:MAG: DUF1002 domain-containing protein [Syntrophomonadaceae bacterium]|nr:DUF1002 domain-containing protein [Syntrophomonadaceae bacterium]